MRTIDLVIIYSLLASYEAYGADVSRQPPLPATPATVILSPWDGVYVGGNVGWGRTEFSDTFTGLLIGGGSQTGTGIAGGVQLGYNKTFNQFLIGLETDYQKASIDTTGIVDAKVNWFGTTRLRAGVLFGPSWLVYATGGVSYGQADLTLEHTGILSITSTAQGVGWTVGGGVEWALGNGFSIGAEYLRLHLNGPNLNVGVGSIGAGINTNADIDVGRGKVNFRF